MQIIFNFTFSLWFVSFVIIYRPRKQCDRDSGVQDVFLGSEFYVQSYLYTNLKKHF